MTPTEIESLTQNLQKKTPNQTKQNKTKIQNTMPRWYQRILLFY